MSCSRRRSPRAAGDFGKRSRSVGSLANAASVIAHSISHQIDVGRLGAAADVVDLTGYPALEDGVDGRTMVTDVQPVADVEAVAVHREIPAFQDVHDHERDQLLGKVVRTVVVGAVGRGDVEPVGVVIGAHQVIRRRLARRIRRIRRVRRGFAETGIVGPERAVHLVGRHVMKAMRLASRPCAARPCAPPSAGCACRRCSS